MFDATPSHILALIVLWNSTCWYKELSKHWRVHTFSPIITGIKWSSKLNSATGIIIVHLRMVNVVSRVGMYSSNAATSSELGTALFPSIRSKINQDYISLTKIPTSNSGFFRKLGTSKKVGSNFFLPLHI